jgi:6-phosphofructokinase 1
MHPSFYDPETMAPSRIGREYLLQIFTNAVGHADVEHLRHAIFDAGSLARPYHSVNTDINKRIRYLS